MRKEITQSRKVAMTAMKFVLMCFLLCLLHPIAGAQTGEGLRVVVQSPRGATTSIDQSLTITVTFNQPMVPLEAVPKDRGEGPLVIDPPIPGKYRWMGSSTLTFQPADTLPYSTGYTLRIPAGTKSLSGQSFAEDVVWTFETPRPRLLGVTPRNGQRFVELDHAIRIKFNQPVDPAQASKHISLTLDHDGSRTFPAYTAGRTETGSTDSLLITPGQPFPRGASITLRCARTLTGSEGLLPMDLEYTSSFTTYNDLRFLGVKDSAGIDPMYPLVLFFSSPVPVNEVLKRLEFTPPLTTRTDYESYDWTTETVSLPFEFAAERSYTGVLKAGLKDRFGNEITTDHTFTFTTLAYEPYVTMGQGIGIIEAYEKHRYPFRSLNVSSVQAMMGIVDTSQIVPVFRAIGSWRRWEGNDDAISPDKLFTIFKDIPINGKRNVQAVRFLNLDDVLGERKTGIVAVQVDSKLKRQKYLKAMFQVTNIGITGKFSPESILLWVTRLKDASPVPNASVELRDDNNRVVWRGSANAQGLVDAPGWSELQIQSTNDWERPRVWAIVSSGADVAFLTSDWSDGIEPWQFSIPYDWNPRGESYQASLFSDRGLYKAGESADLKGIVRMLRSGEWRIPDNVKLRLTVKDPRDENVLEVQPKLSPFGSFAVSVPVPPSGALGYYAVRLERSEMRKGKEEWSHIGGGSFRVEAFRPAEFDVTARADAEDGIIGDTVGAMFNARFLFGAPMKNEKIAWRINASRSYWTPPGHEGYWFEDLGWLSSYSGDAYGRLLASGEGSLDNQGVFSVRHPVNVGDVRGTTSLMLEADVTSPSRQVVSGRASVLLHAGEYYPGLFTSTTFLAKDSLLSLKFIAVTSDSKLVSDRRLTVRTYRRVWRSVRRAETGGRYAWESQIEDVLVDSIEVISASTPVERTYTPVDVGFYYIDVRSTDRRGNPLVAQAYFYCTGQGYVPWERSNDDRIELVSDKGSYRPGESARILVKSPYERATALVSIEREGILDRYTTTLTGSAASIEIPIRSKHLPNVFVSVILLQGRVDSAARTPEADVGRPSFKVGYVKLSVNALERKLAVTATPNKTEYRPGDTVTVNLQVKNAEGKGVRAEIALSVADQGILNLISYRLPDPFDVFYAERSLAVTTSEIRMHMVEQRNYDEKGESTGGGGMEARTMSLETEEGVRKDFRPQAYWNPSIVTNASGRATVRFKLPDNLTAFQVMAVAQTTSSEFGRGESSFAVNKPLLLQPALPRFVRVGDAFEGGVLVFNYAKEARDVTLYSAVQGLKFSGPDSAVHTIPPGQALEVRHRFQAEKVGSAVFRFRATTGTDRDGVQWTIPIQVPRVRETVALSGSVTDAPAGEAVHIPKEIYRDIGDLELTAASTALVGLSGGISYLFHYPYGCLEQRLSSILPIILAEDIVKAFSFEVFKEGDYKQTVSRTMNEAMAFQREDGGFAYWKSADESWPYLTAFAVYTFIQAERNGYTVDESAVDRGVEYLKRFIRHEIRFIRYTPPVNSTTEALALYVLALRGQPDFGYMERMFRTRENLPLFARAYLLKALHVANGNRTMIDDLARDLLNHAKVAPTSAHFEDRPYGGMLWIWDSQARTTALILQALVETQPENPLSPKVVRWLLDEQKSGRWRSTQENIYILDALATYFRAFEKDEPNFRAEILLAGGTALQGLFKGRAFNVQRNTVGMSDLQPDNVYRLDVSREGTGRMYYGVRMNYYPLGRSDAREEGLTVLKSIEPVSKEEPVSDTLSAGTTVRITLTVVSNQERNFIVVDDPLPAGLEAINTSFATTAQSGRSSRRGELEEDAEESDDSYMWGWNVFNHTEQRDDRVVLFADFFPAGVHTFTYLARATSYGVYNMPSTRAEGMYEPEVFGQTAQSVIVVK